MRLAHLLVVSVATLAAVGCADEGPIAGPGTLTARLVSPNGAEGGALLTVFGPGIGEVTPASGELHWQRRGDTLRVLLLDVDGGELGFSVAVDDTTRMPESVVLQVAGPDDVSRADLSGYALELRR